MEDAIEYRALLLESTQQRVSVGVSPTARYDTSTQSPFVQWTVISLGLMQRVQRLIAWETLVNDMTLLVPQLVAAVQLGAPVATGVIGAPQGWSDSVVRDAMLRLVDSGGAPGLKIQLTDRSSVTVDPVQSLATINEWKSSPALMIRRAGAGAADLLRTYLGVRNDAAFPSEIQMASGPIVTIDLAELTGPAPHNGASLVVAGHRALRSKPGQSRLVALFDVHVLPTNVLDVGRNVPVALHAGAVPSPYPTYLAAIRRRSQSTWNDFNVGWRGAALYAHRGVSVPDAVQSFSAAVGTPFVKSLRAASTLPFEVPGSFTGGALVFEMADFGRDPILEALVGQSVPWDPSNSGGQIVNSFAATTDTKGVVAGWAPRRLQGAVFAPQMQPVGGAVEPVQTALERAQSVKLYRLLREFMESMDHYQFDMYRESDEKLSANAIDLQLAAVADVGTGKLRGDRNYHLIPVDKTLDKAELVSILDQLERASKLTYVDLFRRNKVLRPALEAATGSGAQVCVVPLLRRGDANVSAFTGDLSELPVVSTARAVVDSLQHKVTRLKALSRLYRGIQVDDALSFFDVGAGMVEAFNPDRVLTTADRAFLNTFDRADIPAVARTILSGLKPDLADVDGVLRRAAARVPVSVPVPSSKPPSGPKPLDAGWAFRQVDYPNTHAALNTAFSGGVEIQASQMLVRTGLLQQMEVPGDPRTGPKAGPASQELAGYVDRRSKAYVKWTTLETLPGGAALLGALEQLRANQQSGGMSPARVAANEVRAKLKAVFGDTSVFDRMSDTDIVGLKTQAEKLRPLGVSVAGVGAADALEWLQRVKPPSPVVPVSPLSSTSVKAGEVRAKLKAVFGDTIAVDQMNDADLAALETQAASLRPLKFSVAGLGIPEALEWQRTAAERAATAEKARVEQIRKDIEDDVSRLGFPADFADVLVGATDQERAEFKALPAVGALEDLRLSEALNRIK